MEGTGNIVKDIKKYLLMTVKLTFKFLVGEFLKSTRHLYKPASDAVTLSRSKTAGAAIARKKARLPKPVGEDHNFGWLNVRPRMS